MLFLFIWDKELGLGMADFGDPTEISLQQAAEGFPQYIYFFAKVEPL